MIKHLCASNDSNGNPRRLFAAMGPLGGVLAVWDEGYEGHHAVPPALRDAAYEALREPISASTYNWFLKTVPSPTAEQLEDYGITP